MTPAWAYLKSFAVIYGLLLVGQLGVKLLGLPVPGSVVGMVLLAAGLARGLLPVRAVQASAGLLVRHMALLFVPPGVGLIVYRDLLRAEWPAVVLAGVASTVAVLLVVGLLQQRMRRDGRDA